jgi:hypothetical protein
MGSSFSPKDEIWFLRVCHNLSNTVYICIYRLTKVSTVLGLWIIQKGCLTFPIHSYGIVGNCCDITLILSVNDNSLFHVRQNLQYWLKHKYLWLPFSAAIFCTLLLLYRGYKWVGNARRRRRVDLFSLTAGVLSAKTHPACILNVTAVRST